jgi:hypothetical protein
MRRDDKMDVQPSCRSMTRGIPIKNGWSQARSAKNQYDLRLSATSETALARIVVYRR